MQHLYTRYDAFLHFFPKKTRHTGVGKHARLGNTLCRSLCPPSPKNAIAMNENPQNNPKTKTTVGYRVPAPPPRPLMKPKTPFLLPNRGQ